MLVRMTTPVSHHPPRRALAAESPEIADLVGGAVLLSTLLQDGGQDQACSWLCQAVAGGHVWEVTPARSSPGPSAHQYCSEQSQAKINVSKR